MGKHGQKKRGLNKKRVQNVSQHDGTKLSVSLRDFNAPTSPAGRVYRELILNELKELRKTSELNRLQKLLKEAVDAGCYQALFLVMEKTQALSQASKVELLLLQVSALDSPQEIYHELGDQTLTVVYSLLELAIPRTSLGQCRTNQFTMPSWFPSFRQRVTVLASNSEWVTGDLAPVGYRVRAAMYLLLSRLALMQHGFTKERSPNYHEILDMMKESRRLFRNTKGDRLDRVDNAWANRLNRILSDVYGTNGMTKTNDHYDGVCSNCGKVRNRKQLKICQRCHDPPNNTTRYCNAKCQREHFPTHRQSCRDYAKNGLAKKAADYAKRTAGYLADVEMMLWAAQSARIKITFDGGNVAINKVSEQSFMKGVYVECHRDFLFTFSVERNSCYSILELLASDTQQDRHLREPAVLLWSLAAHVRGTRTSNTILMTQQLQNEATLFSHGRKPTTQSHGKRQKRSSQAMPTVSGTHGAGPQFEFFTGRAIRNIRQIKLIGLRCGSRRRSTNARRVRLLYIDANFLGKRIVLHIIHKTHG